MISEPSRTRKAARAILIGGITAGLLDGIFAIVFYGLRGAAPIRILQSIASGLLGRRAFEGGIATAVLGAFFQLLIPTVAAAVYFAFTRGFPVVARHPIACGLFYGIVVYGVMNFVVVPLSAFPLKVRLTLGVLIPGLLAHMFLVGLPIALAIWKYSRPSGNYAIRLRISISASSVLLTGHFRVIS